MNRPSILVILALAIAAATGCASTPDPEPSAARGEAAAPTVFDFARGTWAWARGDSTCLGNRHEISFSADRSEMLHTYDQPLDTLSNDPVLRYRVLAAGDTVHPELPFVIRASMEGESRRTADGELVVWDLIMATPDRYHWHRTDWPDLGVTDALVRCDGRRPLER